MTPLQELTYEQAFSELEAISTQLDDGNLPLETTVTLLSRARALSAHCLALLDHAELRVTRLGDDGSLTPVI